MSSYIGKIKIDNGASLPVGSTLYGAATKTTANNTTLYVANSGNLANVDILIEGLTIHIKFSASNDLANPTLKVGTCDAKPIHSVSGTTIGNTEATSWPANAIVTFTYDGTAWVLNDINTTYTISIGDANGQIKVTPNNGTAYNVSVKGLGSAAYTDTDAYAAASHTHEYAPLNNPTFTGIVTLPAIDGNSAATSAATKSYVDNAVSNVLGATGAMVYKGLLDSSLTTDDTDHYTYKNVPASGYDKGWTYRVNHAGTYAGVECEVGDLVISITEAGSSQSAVVNSHWTVAQTNIDGAVTTSGGTQGALAKFGSNNTLVDGPSFTSGGTGFLKQDGTWATPVLNDSDDKVAQIGISTSGEYPILFKKTTGTTDVTADSVQFGNDSAKQITINPSTGTISAKILKGALDDTVLGIDSTVSTNTFLHKSGAWKTLSISNTTTTIASVTNGVLTLKSTVADSATLNVT